MVITSQTHVKKLDARPRCGGYAFAVVDVMRMCASMSWMLPSTYPEPISIEQYYLLELIAFLGEDACIHCLLAEIGLDTTNHPKAVHMMACLQRMGTAGLLVFRKSPPDFTKEHPFRKNIIFELGNAGKAMLDAMRAYRDAHVAHLRLPPSQ